MTFATLRALQAIIGESIDEIYAAYASESRPHSSSLNSNFAPPSPPSPPLSPSRRHRSPTPPLLSLSNHTLSSASQYSSSNTPIQPPDHDVILDFPDLNFPGDPASPAEQLTSRPDVANAISRIVAASSQLAVAVRSPFLTICDATMIVRPVILCSLLLCRTHWNRTRDSFQKYHLPSCLRFFEASHIPELLSAAGPSGLSVIEISASIGVDSVKISMSSQASASLSLLIPFTGRSCITATCHASYYTGMRTRRFRT
jgi:hypothetical protein